ncbi:MAG: hypothetical protein AAFW70_04875 [Cyanobacteria bacterium J06635_10]
MPHYIIENVRSWKLPHSMWEMKGLFAPLLHVFGKTMVVVVTAFQRRLDGQDQLLDRTIVDGQ